MIPLDRCRIILTVLVASLHSFAQAEEFRFFNFVNMCAPEFECEFRLGEKELVPGGLKSGSETGWFLMPKKDYQLDVTSPMAGPLAESLEADDNSLFVIYTESKTNEEGKIEHVLKLLSLPTHSPEETALRLVSLSANEHEFDFSGQTVKLKPSEVSISERDVRRPSPYR